MLYLKINGIDIYSEKGVMCCWCWVLLVFLLFPTIAWGNDIKILDRVGNTGRFTSLKLTVKGHPVMGYHDMTHRDLKLLRCNDPFCDGDESDNISVLDSLGMVGTYISLVLDASDKPIISYFDASNGTLKLLSCNSPDCSKTNISVPDDSKKAGMYTSLTLDSKGNPVVSYYDFINGDLKLLHCDDSGCTGDESKNISTPDTIGDVGLYTSLALDSDGNPVISYYASDTGLKLLHCDDPYCRDDESSNIVIPDKGAVGWFSSLCLDISGNPVISYQNVITGELKLLHCDDSHCVGDESKNISVIGMGSNISMTLDDRGHPVVSYHDSTNGDLVLLHCDDPGCTGDESGNISVPDTEGDVGQYTSIVLDATGNPVVSYYDFSNGNLKLFHGQKK